MKTTPSVSRHSALILAGSIAALLAVQAAHAVPYDLDNGETLTISIPQTPIYFTGFTPDLTGVGAGTVFIRVNNNDNEFVFDGVTGSGTGAKTLYLSLGDSGNGDREVMTITGAITNASDGGALSLDVHNQTQSDSVSTLNLDGVNTFTGAITLNTPNNNSIATTRIRGAGQLNSGSYAGAISMASRTVFNYASSANQTLSGALSGSGDLVMSGSGTLTLSGAYAHTGSTTISSGTLALDMNGGGSLDSGAALNLGGTLAVLGVVSTASTQTLSNVTFSNGAGLAVTGGASGGTMNLTLDDTWTRNTGVTLGITLGAGGTLTSNPTTANTLVVGTGNIAFATVNGTDWAKVSGGTVVGLSGGDYTVGLPASGASGTDNYSHTDNASVTASQTANTLKLSTTQVGQSLTIDPGATLSLNAGGFLFVGAHDYGITGGTLAGSGGSQKELVVHQHGSGNLTIASVIADNGGATALVKAGPGVLTLTNGSNSFTGNTYLNGGTLNINAVGALNESNGEGDYGQGSLTINGGTTISNTSGGAIDLSSKRNNMYWQGNRI